MAAYRNQQALFRAGDFPLLPQIDDGCSDDSSCAAGTVIGYGLYIIIDQVDRPDGLIGPVAESIYGEVYAIDGIEPALALVVEGSPEGSPRGWYLMRLANGPPAFDDPSETAELEAAWCGVSARFPELAAFLDRNCPPT